MSLVGRQKAEVTTISAPGAKRAPAKEDGVTKVPSVKSPRRFSFGDTSATNGGPAVISPGRHSSHSGVVQAADPSGTPERPSRSSERGSRSDFSRKAPAAASPSSTASSKENQRIPEPPTTSSPSKPRPRPKNMTTLEKDVHADKLSNLISMFKAFDSNNDGNLDRSEMMSIMWTLNPSFTDAELTSVFNVVDMNGDGLIQYEEFIRWLYGDDDALDRLKVTNRTPCNLKITIHGRDGIIHTISASPHDTVRDLRLRMCIPMGVCLSHFEAIRLRLKSKSEDLDDAITANDISTKILQAYLSADVHGKMFSACGSMLYRWTAEVPELKEQVKLSATAKQVVIERESGTVIALIGKSTIVAWNAEDEVLGPLWTASGKSTLTALACNRESVFVGSEDGFVLALSTRTGDELWRAAPHGEKNLDAIHVIHAGHEATGRVFAGAESGYIFAWDAKTGEELWKSLHAPKDREVWHLTGPVREDASNPDSLFSGGGGGSVVCWNSKTGKEQWRFRLHKDNQGVQALFYRELYDTVCVAPRAWASADPHACKLRSLDGRTGESLWSGESENVLFLQGRRQYLFSATARSVQSWDTLNHNLAWEVELFNIDSESIQAFALADDLDALCVGSSEGVYLIDLKNGSVRGKASLKGGIGCLEYSPP